MMEHIETKAQITVTDEGAIEGIAWDYTTPDRVGDVFTRGAFGALDRPIPALFSHDQAQVIGVWESVTETDTGLTVKGRLLVDDIERAREVRAMIRSKAVNGLSIGFVTKKSSRNATGRTITAADLHEVSVVAVPCHPGAQITSLKSDDTAPHMETPNMENEEIEKMIATAIAAIPANDAPGIDTKAFEAVQKRLDDMEAKAARPQGVHIAAPAVNVERKAFESFLRRGVEHMPLDDQKALTVANDINGGYLAPEEIGTELLKLLIEHSPLRSYAKVVSISAPEITYPKRLTGTAATWVDEIANRTSSAPTFDQLKLTPHELATYTDVSTKLLEDNAFNLEGELMADFAESFGKTEGLAFVKGTGTGQPTGIMVNTDIAEIKTGKADGFLTTAPADVLIAMYHKVATTYAQNGVWLMNRNTLAVLRQWKDGNGRYLVLDPISQGAPTTLLGRPVVEMLDMDDIGAGKAPILFGDMSGYRIVDRIGLSTLRDPLTLATNGQIRFHARKRVGADVTHEDRFIKLRVAV